MSTTSDEVGNPGRRDVAKSPSGQTDVLLPALDDYEAGRTDLHAVRDVLQTRLADNLAIADALIHDVKERYRQERLPLDSYLQLLADIHRLVPEEELATEARPRASATVVADSPPVPPVVAASGAVEKRDAPSVVRSGPRQPQAAAGTARATRSRSDGLRLTRLLDRGGDQARPTAPGEKPGARVAAGPASAAVGPGTVLGGRFQLGERVGKGGTGDVYRACDLLLAEFDTERATVAVKILNPALRRDPDLLDAILRSAAATRRLQHPNIAQVFEFHRFGDHLVIVMEWLEGESLARRLDRAGHPALSPREFGRMVRSVGAALDYAHSISVVHGDIKPANVFLTADDRVRVLDFGFAGWLDAGEAIDPGTPRHGVTSAYASSEVLQGSAPTPGDDIYSLAALMYRMLAGSSPHGLRDAAEADRAGVKPARPPGLSGRQWRVLERGLAPRRAQRLKEAAPLVAAFATSLPRRRARALGAGMLLILVGAAMAWLVVTGRLPANLDGSGAGQRETVFTVSEGTDVQPSPAAPSPPLSAGPQTAPAMPAPLPPTAATEDELPITAQRGAPEPSGGDATAHELADASPIVAETPSALAGNAATDVRAESALPEPAGVQEETPQQLAQEPVAVPAAEPPAPAPQPVRRAAPQGPPPVLGFARGEDPVLSESDGFVRLRISASATLQAPVSVTVTARDGSAGMGEDFAAPLTDRFMLSARQPSAQVLIPLLSDSISEHVEDFAVVLGIDDGRATLGDNEVIVLILDDD